MSHTLTKQTLRKSIFVCVTRALNNQLEDENTVNVPLADISRGFWEVDHAQASQCELLVAVARNEIIGVWEINRTVGWRNMATLKDIPTRNPAKVDGAKSYCELLDNTNLPETCLIGSDIRSITGMDRFYGRHFQYNF